MLKQLIDICTEKNMLKMKIEWRENNLSAFDNFFYIGVEKESRRNEIERLIEMAYREGMKEKSTELKQFLNNF